MANHSTNTRERRRQRALGRYTSKRYAPYVLAIGQIALSWNDLHEVLCSLFATISGGIDDWKLQAAWQSLPSDRAKRGMLKAIFSNLSWEDKRHNPRAEEDVRWLFGQLDRLEEDRNNAVHAPLSTFDSWVWEALAPRTNIKRGEVQPDFIRENKRAANLKNKNLLTEYRCVRDEIVLFRNYVEAIEDAWTWAGKNKTAWPERPRLPNRGQKSPAKARQKDSSKQLPLLPESSRE